MWWDEITLFGIWFVVFSIPEVGYRTWIVKHWLVQQWVIKDWWEEKLFAHSLPQPQPHSLDLKAVSGWAGRDDEPLPMHQFLKPRQPGQIEMEFNNTQ